MVAVAITGLGAITSLGLNVPTLWQNIVSGKSGIISVAGTEHDINPDVKVFGKITDFDPGRYMDDKAVRRTDRFAQFAVAAAQQAKYLSCMVLGVRVQLLPVLAHLPKIQ